MFQIGDTAPDFELLNDEGQPTKLSDLRGRRVVLFFYPKADTPGCTTQACGLRDNFPLFQEHNATVLGVSPDSVADLAKWRTKQNLPYNLLSDPEHSTAEAYGVWGEKSMYGKTYFGIIRSHFVIAADGTFEDVQVKVSPQDSIARAVKVAAGV
ncbi:MAG: thioredoxin-dependent thiol peroxidase [Chloroflexi bacterium]|nr:thioredoxin-dependent thiol peroxidase [Chloroflexota bacterium]MDA0243255.1 thioredoxin-dependent thiol peroxidase [Chloroflexota bacterium]